ncbi:MAG: hypothetical protein HOC70_03375 [Gammaproteobacteria bacterium]|jgi:3-dehydroquinate synthase|nr:hypothetical protein [Gammaproteobacteria bacterium]MBT4492258.1 hypothetical protein [Gammaproteobacteria bacterium]MBT7370227.1 hypothetical protein [Gammaproteobacteria bacterium]
MRIKPRQVLIAFHVVLLVLIILPFLLWGEEFDALTLELMSGQRAAEVFVATSALLAMDIFIPVPSSAVSVSAGMLLGAPMAFVSCTIGLTAGCFLGYGFGYYFRRFHFNRWHDDPEFRKLSMQLSKYGYILLLFCRGIPVLAEMSLMVAGFHRYPFGKFLLITLVGNLTLAGLYTYLGDSVQNIGSVYLLIVVLLMVPALSYSIRLWWLNRVVAE